MKDKPLVSVIIPVYNGEKTLPYLLQDLEMQSFPNSEFILINDGSTDKSKILIEEFIHKTDDSRFVLLDQANSGVSIARNEGIKNSRGQYIMFADADDRLDKNFVKGYVEKIIKNKTDMEVFSLNKIDDTATFNITEKVDYSELSKKEISYSTFFGYLADGLIHGYVVSFITKRYLWDQIKFDEKIAYREDEFAYCQMLIKNPNMKIHFNPESYYYYFLHDSSATNRVQPKDVLQSIKISDLIIQQAEAVRRINIPTKRLNQLKSNFYWKMLVVSILKKDKLAFKIARKGYLEYYPKTNFYQKKSARRIQYYILKMNLDFMLKFLVLKVKG